MPFRRSYPRDEAILTDDRAPAAVDERTTTRPAREWSPAQIVGLIAGIGFTVLGIAAIASTGFDTSHVYTPQNTVWHLSHSPVLALCEIGFGVLMIIASVVPGGQRELMLFLGAVALAFGIVILTHAARSNIHKWFGVTNANGWLFAITGGVILLAGLFSPTFFGSTRTRQVAVR